jgi:glutamate dehydrogenase
VEEIYSHQLAITSQVLDCGAGLRPEKAIDTWIQAHRAAVDRAEQILAELWSTDISDISMIAVASRQLRPLADSANPR